MLTLELSVVHTTQPIYTDSLVPSHAMLYTTYLGEGAVLQHTQADLCVTVQYPSFTDVEDALRQLTQYYKENSLCANPNKTQVTAFHLQTNYLKLYRTRDSWTTPLILNTWVSPLDRMLSYEQHVQTSTMKVATINSETPSGK